MDAEKHCVNKDCKAPLRFEPGPYCSDCDEVFGYGRYEEERRQDVPQIKGFHWNNYSLVATPRLCKVAQQVIYEHEHSGGMVSDDAIGRLKKEIEWANQQGIPKEEQEAAIRRHMGIGD